MSSRCRSYYPVRSQSYVPVFTPLACPDPVNNDPKRNEALCRPALCRSEPLSHAEYLRKLVENNGNAISSGRLLQQGSGIYTTTNWMATTGPCQRQMPVPPAQTVMDAGQLTDKKGAYASRGVHSKFDRVNTNDETTTNRRRGAAIAAEKGCTVCTTSGLETGSTNCNC